MMYHTLNVSYLSPSQVIRGNQFRRNLTKFSPKTFIIPKKPSQILDQLAKLKRKEEDVFANFKIKNVNHVKQNQFKKKNPILKLFERVKTIIQANFR